jgi:DNA-binding CsgD family transcriptional regulator
LGTTLNSKSYNLTPRELEVAHLVKQGKSNKQIAELLDISVRSVESHRRMIRRKLGLRGKDRNLRSFLLSFR